MYEPVTGSTTPAEELSKAYVAVPVPKDDVEDGLTVASNSVFARAVQTHQLH